MAIRFTEFLKYDNKDVNLYVVQENQEAENLCFRVHIKDGDKAVILLCKTEENNWQISPQILPQWLEDLKPCLVSAIENEIVKVKPRLIRN